MRLFGIKVWELLSVIAIVCIVIAILAPTYYKIQFGTYHGACASNEKEIAIAVMQYAQENDGSLPDIAAAPGSKDTWRSAIFPYMRNKGVYLCPARRDKADGPDGFPRSYAANSNGTPRSGKDNRSDGAFAGPGSKPIRLADIPHPGGLIMLCESAGGNTPEFNIDGPVHFGPAAHLLWAGHSGGSDYLFADGHVKWLKPQATKDEWHRDAAVPLSANGIAVLAETATRAGE